MSASARLGDCRQPPALPTGVAYLPRYAAVSATADHRYLDALAVVDDPAQRLRNLLY